MGREAVTVHGADSIYLHPMEFRSATGGVEAATGWRNSPELSYIRTGSIGPIFFWGDARQMQIKYRNTTWNVSNPLKHVDKWIKKLPTRTNMVQDIVHEKSCFGMRGFCGFIKPNDWELVT